MLFDYAPLLARLAGTPLEPWIPALEQAAAAALDPQRHGDIEQWAEALARLPALTPEHIDLAVDCIEIGHAAQLGDEERAQLAALLQEFHPWRKGPFCLFGIHLDTEWRSDWKWNRLAGKVALAGRRVLDVGCGNGYYGWRMLGAGAELVLGVDPTLRYVMQYFALSRLLGPTANLVLPLTLEALPTGNQGFDTVFSMGVLYHRKDPMEHLARLRSHLAPGGQLVLEGLVIEGGPGEVLRPDGRYAKMRNVHALPSCPTLEGWLGEAGYRNIRLLDLGPTRSDEQRRTPWMRFESLADFLDPDDADRTIEGHPAPLRAIMLAEI